jgi:hypothetical protein
MPRGGPREGSGRKSKAEELGLPALIEEIIGEEGKRAIIEKLAEKAKAGSFLHQQLLMAYMFGKPTDKVDLTSGGQAFKAFTLNIKPDLEEEK